MDEIRTFGRLRIARNIGEELHKLTDYPEEKERLINKEKEYIKRCIFKGIEEHDLIEYKVDEEGGTIEGFLKADIHLKIK